MIEAVDTLAPSLPPLHLVAPAWASLSPQTQAEVGRLAIQEALLCFAAGAWQGEDGEPFVYLDADGRDEADEAANATRGQLHNLVEANLPDLFGHVGADPAWARVLPLDGAL